ncbi:hypothetical protein Hanom_Chr14g01279571 [Helianthus anomalus]
MWRLTSVMTTITSIEDVTREVKTLKALTGQLESKTQELEFALRVKPNILVSCDQKLSLYYLSSRKSST